MHLISLCVVLTLVWLGWSGHYEALTLALGAGSLVFVLALSHRMRIVDDEGAPLGLHFGRILVYVVWLGLEIVKSNLDVARRILTPGPLRISPRMVRVRPEQTTDVGRVVFANSITLTPGTVSVDVADGEILVHALHEESARGLLEGDMNRKCAELERSFGRGE